MAGFVNTFQRTNGVQYCRLLPFEKEFHNTAPCCVPLKNKKAMAISFFLYVLMATYCSTKIQRHQEESASVMRGIAEQCMNKTFCSFCCSEASKKGLVGPGSSLMRINKYVEGNC